LKNGERHTVRSICEHVLEVVDRTKGTSNKEVQQQRVVRLRALLRRGRLREAEDLAYGALMECNGFSGNNSDEEAAGNHETSKAPMTSVTGTVDIGRSIKFVRVAAGIKQGEMAKRLDISQNYLSLLENNKAEPSLSLLRRISSEFRVPVSFLLLEASHDFESDDPETDSLLKHLKDLIHQLQETRIRDGTGAADGAGTSKK
jgi:transcriptional regulator with XRE-family HTH domain